MMLEANDLPCFTREVIREVSLNLGLPSEEWMQDWPIEVTDSDRIKDFIDGYASEDRTEHRSAIATLIISCLDDLFAQDEPIPEELLERIAAILAHHPQELGYWARWEEDSSLSWFSVTPWIRSLDITPPTNSSEGISE